MEVIGFEEGKVIGEIPDLRPGQEGKMITIQYDPKQIFTLTCERTGKQVHIIEDDIKFLDDDGLWKSYPCIKGCCSGNKFFTEVFVVAGEGEMFELALKVIEP
jgi:hypothetical protein